MPGCHSTLGAGNLAYFVAQRLQTMLCCFLHEAGTLRSDPMHYALTCFEASPLDECAEGRHG